MDLHLRDRVVIVTGGTDGLGAALADRLLEEGARVAVCGRDPDRLAAAEERLAPAGDAALVLRADVTVTEDVQRLVGAAGQRWGRVDGLVNNAGRSAVGGIETYTDEGWADDFDLKLLGAARATRAALPYLRAAGGGSIVNVLAIAAKAAPAGSLPTAASRAAGLALTKSLSKELGPDGIRVNAVLVGIVESGQWRRDAAAAGMAPDELYARAARDAGIPLGRVGRAGEFADLAAYLLSDRSSFVSGAAINLDGGASPVP